MKTQELVDMERMAALLAHVQPISFGTIWWVPERVWTEHARRYDINSERMAHPGVATNERRLPQSLDPVPMLHGTSHREFDAVKIDQVSSGHASYVGHLPPCGIPFRHWRSKDPDAVKLNESKPSMSDAEKSALKIFLQKKGWL